MSQFQVDNDIMNNQGIVYTVTKVDSFYAPPTPPGEDPLPGDGELTGYKYTIEGENGLPKQIWIGIDDNPNNIDTKGMHWTKTLQRGGKKSKKSKKSRKSKKSKKSRKSRK
jgi:hypothetical protein